MGQGLAGTVLAWTLRRAGFEVKIIDRGHEKAASNIAAGIINPVTGPRYVKSWILDEMLPVARSVYQKMGDELGCQIWQDRKIIKILSSVKEENDWSARCGQPEYSPFLSDRNAAGGWENFIQKKSNYRFGEVSQAAQVDLPKLLFEYRKKGISEGWILSQSIDFQQVEFKNEQAFYRSENFGKVIFCEGWSAENNPFFHLKNCWRPAKGEALIVKIPGLETAEILKKQVLIAPLGDSKFWVGSSYAWHFDDEKPTASERRRFENELAELVGKNYEVIDHLAAIRPTITDMRPVIGFSAKNPSVGLFNGLGTKGTLLAPFWAETFCEHILTGKRLSQEVDLQRFIKN